jgi:hypothetical protein
MAILNLKDVTIAVKKLLKNDLLPRYKGLTIERNRMRNENPNLAFDGWIGIYKANRDLEAYAIGPKMWRDFPEILIEIQYAHASEESAEDGLHDLEQAVLNVLATKENSDLNETVSFTAGYNIAYEILSDGSSPYWQSSLITLRAEART